MLSNLTSGVVAQTFFTFPHWHHAWHPVNMITEGLLKVEMSEKSASRRKKETVFENSKETPNLTTDNEDKDH